MGEPERVELRVDIPESLLEQIKLCYVEGTKAYFTSVSLDSQWGDDWNDAPYEHNAGPPYGPSEHDDESWDIVSVYFEGYYKTPDEDHLNSPYSVEKINKKHVPWLTPYDLDTSPIFAGTTLKEFIQEIQRGGGKVFVELGTLGDA